MSLEGPVTAVINSSTAAPDMQSFSLQPSTDAPSGLATSYANVTLAVQPGDLGYIPQASLRDTFYPNRTCFSSSVSVSATPLPDPCMHGRSAWPDCSNSRTSA